MKAKSYQAFSLRYLAIPVYIYLALFISACEEQNPSAQDTSELFATVKWNSESKTLALAGHVSGTESRVEVYDVKYQEKIARTNVLQSGKWYVNIDNLTRPPCEILIKTEKESIRKAINTDHTCAAGSSIRARANTAPEGHILLPQSDVNIFVGDTVNFEGHGIDPDQVNGLRFNWDFDGAANNNVDQVPGMIQFNQTGIYRVQMRVQDDQGANDATPPIRIIRVQDPQNRAPDSIIAEPAGDITITVGDSINFRGEAADPEGDNPIEFEWDFAGVRNNDNRQNPGRVQFDQEGMFRIRMQAMDAFGALDITPDERLIRVVGQNQFNRAPESAIIQPVGEQFIGVGDVVRFQGLGSDPEGDSPLSFLWDFAGVTRSNLQSPGDVMFNTPGQFEIRMWVMDAMGNQDTSPAITLVNVGLNPPQNATNQPPESAILEPANDMIINQGDSIGFRGEGLDPEGDNPLILDWNFDGVAQNRQGDNLGNIRFDQAGTFRIRMAARDNQDNADQTPAQRLITVIGNNSNNLAPDSHILEPQNNLVINVGDAVRFRGHGVDPEGATNLAFDWDFDGALVNDTAQNPGDMVFDRAGVFNVRMAVMDDQGNRDQTPDLRQITVIGNNLPPDSIIVSPQNDISIGVGDVVRFEGQGIDPDQNNPLRFRWQFDGEAAAINQQNSGDIQFNNAGQYNVLFTVIDGHDLSDPTPDMRTITVR